MNENTPQDCTGEEQNIQPVGENTKPSDNQQNTDQPQPAQNAPADSPCTDSAGSGLIDSSSVSPDNKPADSDGPSIVERAAANIPAQSPAPQPATPAVPGPELDPDLEQEIEAALGDASIMDIYAMDDSATAAASSGPAVDESDPPPGVIRGKVVGISGDDIFIDLGGKSQALLPRNELDPDEQVEIGSTMYVAIVGYDKKDGLIILSKKTAEQQLLRRNLKRGVLVEARVTGSNKGGLEMDIKGLKAFMPASQISFQRIENLDTLIGELFTCEVVEVERGDKNIVLSRRNILAKERQEQKELLWQELEKGQCRRGVVSRLTDFGAFIDLGGVDGLLHVSEMSWARVKDPSEILQTGQEIDVVVIALDPDKQRISLSLKKAAGDPWTSVELNYPPGTRCQAQIVNLMDFGAFAQLEPGIEGLIPISEMSWAGRIRHPRDVVNKGMMVEVEVLTLDTEKRRLSLSMKQLQTNPWSSIGQKYQVNETFTGKVVKLADFGAFVNLEEGIDGLIHISQMSDKHVGKPGDIVSVGDEVQVRVLGVDTENQKISLSLKGLTSAAEHATPQQSPATDTAVDSKKSKDRPNRGGLFWDHGNDAAGGLGLKL